MKTITINFNFEDATLQQYAEWRGNIASEIPVQEPVEYIKAYWKGAIMSDINAFLDQQAERIVREQVALSTEAAKADAQTKIEVV